jgi:hypothetical protein
MQQPYNHMNRIHATVRMDIIKTLYIKVSMLNVIQFVAMEQSNPVNNATMETTTTPIAVQMHARSLYHLHQIT